MLWKKQPVGSKIANLNSNKAGFVSFGTITASTFSDFLKSVCATYYNDSEENKVDNFVATWAGNYYYNGLIRKRGTAVYCMLFIGNDIASCQYNATSQTISVNDINSNVNKLDSNMNETTNILASALACTKTTFFKTSSSSSYTGTLPSNSYKVSTFIVNVRGGGRFVTATNSEGGVATNYYTGDAWTGWQELALNSNLTSKFKVTDLGSFASESALATGLSTKIGTMANGEVAFIQIQMSAATTNFGAFAYVGTLTRVAATYASFSVSVTTSGNASHTVVGSMNNSTWKMEQVALNSRIKGDISFAGNANKRYCYLKYNTLSALWGGCFIMLNGNQIYSLELKGQNTSQTSIRAILEPSSTSTPTITLDTSNNRLTIDAGQAYVHWGIVVYGQATQTAYIDFQ